MKSQLDKTINQLSRIAKKAQEKPHHSRLLWDILINNKSMLNFKTLFLPEELSIGIKTDLYKNFNEEQKLFLNHLSYYIHYYRINGAEKIAIQNNIAIANNLNSKEMDDYLILESQINYF